MNWQRMTAPMSSSSAAEGSVFSAGHDLKEINKGKGRSRRWPGILRTRDGSMLGDDADPCPMPRSPSSRPFKVSLLPLAANSSRSCDLAVASADAGFATPGVNIGLFCSTPMVALSRNVGRKHAMEMLLTGETISAASRPNARPRQSRRGAGSASWRQQLRNWPGRSPRSLPQP